MNKLIYLPYANVKKSAECFDDRILSRQITTINQVICCNIKMYNGFAIPDEVINHSDYSIWNGAEYYLLFYLEALLLEYYKRFRIDHFMLYNINFLKSITHTLRNNIDFINPEFLIENQKELLKKNKKHYKKWF